MRYNLDKLKKNIEMTVTAEGLRIELLESEKGTFFDSGSSTLNKSGQEMLAAELGKVPNHISVEGHTDAKPFTGKRTYSNWELSADRANAARRLMQQSGFRPDQVSQVRGFADQRLRNLKDPLDPSNRRISIIVQYISKNSDEAESPGRLRKYRERGNRQQPARRRNLKPRVRKTRSTKKLATWASLKDCFRDANGRVVLPMRSRKSCDYSSHSG
jgi:chemotaxis protein MotB